MIPFDTSILENLILGRIEPHIYAFTTNTVPNYLKVGDTYRPVNVRLDEWRDYFPNLEHDSNWEWLAKTENGKYFRDFAIHYYLETIKRLHRLQPDDIKDLPYYSREFFEKATPKDINEAISDIEQYATIVDGSRQYQFYSEERLPEETHFARVDNYDPRPNQESTIQRFIAARKKRHKNLLMYAVMRFGKSFTSMCCATEIDAKVVLVVSAKADVKNEWKKTVESHIRFADYHFLCSDNLREDKAISKKLEEGKRVVVFLTLQDLMGNDVKRKHKDLFHQKVDLLIVDETHFGARAEEYGKVLRNVNKLTDAQIKKEQSRSKESTFDDLEKGLESIKSLNVDTTLHLSGTPYRILMGSEFKPDDIIAFYQFTDIIDDKEKWDREHQEENEWNNPYYGFPQMIRFAFNPSDSARKLMEQLKSEGKTTQLNELFRPASISKDTSAQKKHCKFEHENEVFELLNVIDGSKEDKNLLGFLDYDKLKEGNMCRHIVMVLPFCASCDAMEKLIGDHKDEFKNLNEYTLVNIAGHESNFDTTEEIKHHIKQLESEGKKTITLTVNRMLTGSTVREWDTMIFLKDVSSPQEYDQAIFRLQNQYVTTYKDDDGDTIKYNMKPQTLLVDFDPNRMFFMQEQKSKIYNVNTNERGNDELESRLKRELEISPIIVINKGKIAQVTPTNIMDAVRDYSANRTVMDEATAVPTDFELLEDPNMLDIIKRLDPINNKKGLNIKPNDGEGDDYDNSDDEDGKDGASGGDKPTKEPAKTEENNDDQLDKRLASFFAQILFYALLTDDSVKSLNEVIQSSKRNKNNKRIMCNVGLEYDQLKYLQKHINPFVLSDLDYKINNINDLLSDPTFEPLERVERALQKFGRLSVSEIVTPTKVADDMVALLPKESINSKTRFLDIASKQGEFACALYKRFGLSIKDNIYALPTSKLTYEFTYKVFKLLDIPTKNIIANFNTYDLIGENKDTYIQILKDMHLEIIIGNPPYNMEASGAANGSDPIYHFFIEIARGLTPIGVTIQPGRFLFNAGKTPKEWNEKMLNDEHLQIAKFWTKSDEVFPLINLMGGISIIKWNVFENYGKTEAFFSHNELRLILQKVKTIDFKSFSNMVYGRDLYKLSEVLYKENPSMENRQSKGHKYDVGSSFFDVFPELLYDNKPIDDNEYALIIGRGKNGRVEKWFRKDYLRIPDNFDFYKIFIPKSNGSGAIGEVPTTQLVGEPILGNPTEGCTTTFLNIGKLATKEEAVACLKYIKTKFARTMLGTLKVTQDNPKPTWANVPLLNFTEQSDIDWSKPIPEIDKQLYAKYGLTDDEVAFIESMIKAME